jgi:two-component system OmpR family sensor kinase
MRRTTLAVRITTLCLLVAGIAALVAGLVLFRLVTSTTLDVTRRVLADQADVVAAELTESNGALAGRRRVVDILEGQGISVVTIGQRGLVSGEPNAVAAAAQAGVTDVLTSGKVAKTVESDGRTYLVEARETPRGGFALVLQPASDRSTVRRLIGNILFALGIGLLVAAVAGVVLGRLLARPLRRTAQVAHTMRGGRRDLRVPVEGPREVADVAGSVNELADALQRSESRQRDFLLSVSHELRTPLTAWSTGPTRPRSAGRSTRRPSASNVSSATCSTSPGCPPTTSAWTSPWSIWQAWQGKPPRCGPRDVHGKA